MRLSGTCLVLGLLFSGTSIGLADDAGSQSAKATGPQSADEAAIRATEATFAKAFDAGNAKAVAEHWTMDGEYIDEGGSRTQGREAIAAKYAAFFAANPKARIAFRIDRIRLVGKESAIEDGTATVIVPDREGDSTSQYSVVHVQRDGKWLMASVRDSVGQSPTRLANVKSLGWLIGAWVTESKGVEYRLTCRWIVDDKFIEQSFESRQGNKVLVSGKQIIGFDPARQAIGCWTFTSDGGHATGRLTFEKQQVVVETNGVLADGTETSAVNIVSKLDDKAIAWRSVDRTVGENQLPDTEEVLLRREAPARAAK